MKTNPGLMALDCIAVALVGLLLLELHFATEPPDVPAQRSASPTQLTQTRNISASQPMVPAWRDTMLGRPLFDPTRRPPAAATEDTATSEEIPRLSGIMVTPTEKIAVFSPAMGAPIVVNQNSRFGVFTVLAIAADGVTISGPHGIVVLRSDFIDAGRPEISTAKTTFFADGIYLSLIRITLPSVLKWQIPPTAH